MSEQQTQPPEANEVLEHPWGTSQFEDGMALAIAAGNLMPGERLTYFVGDLMWDRDAAKSRKDNERLSRLNDIGDNAWALQEFGNYHLFQRRVSAGVFAYEVVRAVRKRSGKVLRRVQAQ